MFSIIIPLYNKVQYIQRAIDSVLYQNFQEFEVIVVNDGSTDGGEQKVASEYGDRIRLINQANQGVSQARNSGIAEANCEYLAFLDADDYWHPNYLDHIRIGLEKFPGTGIIGSSYAITHEELGLEDSKGWFEINDYFKRAIVNTLFFTSATVVKKSFFLQNPGFDRNLARGEDLDVWFRSVLFFGNPAYTFSKLVYYSSEDETQATNRQFPVERALVSKILGDDYATSQSSQMNNNFEAFRHQYVYFNLLPYISDPQNNIKIKSLLKKIDSSYFFLRLVYFPYFGFNRFLMKSAFGKNLIRNYLKFCLRYFYNP